MPAMQTRCRSVAEWHSCARVGLGIGQAEFLLADVRVPLRCARITVTEEFLDAARVGSVVHQVRGEGMTQRVRMRPAGDAHPFRGVVEKARHVAARDGIAAGRQEHGGH